MIRYDEDTVLKAFTRDWERLGDVVQRLGLSHGNQIISEARVLLGRGLVEQTMYGGHYAWRLSASGTLAVGGDAKQAPGESLSSPTRNAGGALHGYRDFPDDLVDDAQGDPA